MLSCWNISRPSSPVLSIAAIVLGNPRLVFGALEMQCHVSYPSLSEMAEISRP
jgi:hypothetical protein